MSILTGDNPFSKKHISEISKETLKSYHKKAVDDAIKTGIGKTVKNSDGKTNSYVKPTDADLAHSKKRITGAAKAMNKIVKKVRSEETDLTEKKGPCWKGYKKVKGKADYEDGSCVSVSEGDEMKGLTQKGGHKRSTDSGAGLTQKGVDAVNRKTGGNLKTAVTTPPSKLDPDSKAAKRRKSFCARSRSWNGERGKAARARWNC